MSPNLTGKNACYQPNKMSTKFKLETHCAWKHFGQFWETNCGIDLIPHWRHCWEILLVLSTDREALELHFTHTNINMHVNCPWFMLKQWEKRQQRVGSLWTVTLVSKRECSNNHGNSFLCLFYSKIFSEKHYWGNFTALQSFAKAQPIPIYTMWHFGW